MPVFTERAQRYTRPWLLYITFTRISALNDGFAHGQAIIDAAYADPDKLIHTVTAPAGATSCGRRCRYPPSLAAIGCHFVFPIGICAVVVLASLPFSAKVTGGVGCG